MLLIFFLILHCAVEKWELHSPVRFKSRKYNNKWCLIRAKKLKQDGQDFFLSVQFSINFSFH